MEEIFLEWFDVYLHLRNTYNIIEKNIYNMDKKSNILGPTLSVKVIIYIENKSSFCSTTINWEWVLIIEVIFGDKEKDPIYIIFKRLDIKSTYIEFIQNIKSEAKKWGGIEIKSKE